MNRIYMICWILMIFLFTACANAGSNPTVTPEPAPTATKVIQGVEFIKTFGGKPRDRGINLIDTADGGFAIVGYTSSFDAESEDVYLVRTDANGDLLWERTYGGPERDNGWDLLETDDGGFLIAGFTDSIGAGKFDIYLIRTDQEGNLLWENTFGGPEDDLAWSIVYSPEGNIAIGGQTESFGAGDKDGYLVIVDPDGNEILSNTFGGENEDRLYSIDLGVDGGFVLTGTTTSSGAGGRNAYIVKTDPEGQEEWEGVFGEDLDDVAHAVRSTLDGKYILTGYTKSFGAANYDSWSIKLDGDGEMVWQKFFGGANDDRTIYGEQTVDGGFIQIGYTRSFGARGWDVFVLRSDQDGEILWQKEIGGGLDDTGYSIIQARDGSYFLTGESYSFGAGSGDLLLVKLSQDQ